jgi:acetate kinase
MDAKAIEKFLYTESGLLGVSGISNDMRDLLASDDPRAKEAIELFVYHIIKNLGALTAVLGGIDALVFTAGIGEHAPEIRERVCRRAEWIGVRLDPRCERCGRPSHYGGGKPSLGMGDPDRRGANDRHSHPVPAY